MYSLSLMGFDPFNSSHSTHISQKKSLPSKSLHLSRLHMHHPTDINLKDEHLFSCIITISHKSHMSVFLRPKEVVVHACMGQLYKIVYFLWLFFEPRKLIPNFMRGISMPLLPSRLVHMVYQDCLILLHE
jgi:hypothetical protein